MTINKDIFTFFEDTDLNDVSIDKLVTHAFIKINNIKIKNNVFIQNISTLNISEKQYLLPFIKTIKSKYQEFSFELLIDIFEYLILPIKQQTNGAVYTPKIIKDYIIDETISKLDKPLNSIIGADIACGCGAFLYSLAIKIYKETNLSLIHIIENQLFGLDISKNSIKRVKILLSLLALSKGEDKSNINFNLFIGNALAFDWKEIEKIKRNNGFDIILGNPPYVRSRHISESSRKLLKNWKVTKTGNPDLYIPFFEIGYENLNTNGVLGYITINTFYRSVNARSLRKYFGENQINAKIIDFGHEQIFKNKLTYTCLCFLSKSRSKTLKFAKTNLNNLNKLNLKDYTSISYKNLNAHRGWLLNSRKAIKNVQKIEKCGKPLGELFTIKNGIATLSNNIYIFKPIAENDRYFFLEKDGKQFEVEKAICRNIIKPNVLKYEHEIPQLKEKIIYPYTNGIKPLSLMEEEHFKSNFPKAYFYLNEYQELLSRRDKGKGDYGAWYAYGRTQALTDKGLKLLFPYMAKHPYFVFTDEKEMLIYCGYAIYSESEKDLLVMKKLLESKIFNYYMQNTSKPYASGYLSYAKNYVKYFGVCELSENEKIEVLNLKEAKEIDAFFMTKYKVII